MNVSSIAPLPPDQVRSRRVALDRHRLDPAEPHLAICRACGRPWPCDVAQLMHGMSKRSEQGPGR
jgi:hypothetical protein